jgi:glycosyltransferase involved in cell wall biosynthesis
MFENKKLISVILPTRGRGESLLKTLDSVINNCKNIGNIEILIKVDIDDTETVGIIDGYVHRNLITTIISDRKNGYASLNEFYNELYEKSLGEFIFCINDDLIISTPDWDLLVEPFRTEFVCLHHNPTAPHNDTWYFPIISKKILDIIGCVSKSVFYDGYLYFMLLDLNLFRHIDLTIHHLTLSDDLTADKLDVIDRFKQTEWEFDSKRDLMKIDRDKIINFLNEK